MFKRWKNIPEVADAVDKLDVLSKKHSQLLSTGKNDDKVQAQKVWVNMASSYWEILFAILDAQTQNNPDKLFFDDEEKLFINLGYLSGITEINKDLNLKNFLSSKCDGGIFPYLAFSDYIAECWGMITGNELPESEIGADLNGRIEYLKKELSNTQTQRDNALFDIAEVYSNQFNAKSAIQNMDDFLLSSMKVNMRVPEYREGDETTRQNLSQQRKAYKDSENAVLLMISSAQKNEANPLPIPKAERFLAVHEKTKVLVRKILYSQIDSVKIARRVKKINDNCANMSAQMKRNELKNMLVKKREYVTVPAKNARCDTSLLCQSDSVPIDYKKNAAELENMSNMDIEMFNVPRVRMYGIPRVIFVPGQGLGTYDWLDHSLLIPVFPVGGDEKSLSYALATFRWDSDEDRKLKTPYEQIKENRKKSLLAMASSFYKDYSLWQTKEKKGYRILPRETHKVFVQMFAQKPEE